MKLCPKCFVASTWPANAPSELSAYGTCEICRRGSTVVWDASCWAEPLRTLLELYEPSVSGEPISVLVERDWALLRTDDRSLVHRFLREGLGAEWASRNYPEEVDSSWRRRSDAHEFYADWEKFAIEIVRENRYHPRFAPDFEVLAGVFDRCTRVLMPGDRLYRARVSGADGLLPAQLGAPPVDKAVAGRANPVGIPYLYLAKDATTAMHEVRVGRHSYVSVGSFEVLREVRLLALEDIDRPDFFSEDPRSALELHEYMRGLAHELRKPVAATDLYLDYIPTQYLCEKAKEQLLDGVSYGSSMHEGGINVVLFREDAVSCRDVELYKIDGIELSKTLVS